MAAKVLFERTGINAPGRVNAKLDGRCQEFCIDNLSQDQMKQLYEDGFPYVGLTAEGRKKYFPEEKPITTEKIKTPKK
jgi:hypothetical protein